MGQKQELVLFNYRFIPSIDVHTSKPSRPAKLTVMEFGKISFFRN